MDIEYLSMLNSASGGYNPPSPRRGGICHINFLKEYHESILQKKSARETRVGLGVLAYIKLHYFAYSEKRVRASVFAVSRQVIVNRIK